MDIGKMIITALISALVTAIVTGFVTSLVNGAKHSKKKWKKIEDGVQSLLRAEIIRQSEKWLERGFCPIYAKDALTKEYASYHELGGNGTITGIYNELMELPTEKPPRKTKNGGIKNGDYI